MASRVAMNAMGNLPVKTVNAFEGTLTRYASVSPRGGDNEGAAVYQYPIVKGDLVKLVAEDTAGRVTVQKAGAGPDIVHGIAVASPQGIDNTTASTDTPADSLQRRIDVAFFGLAIVELTAKEAITPGHAVEWDTSVANAVETSGAAPTANGQPIALALGADGVKIPVLLGFVGVAADT